MVGYIVFRFFICLFRFIPFRILHIFSDVVSFIMFGVFKYRINVVDANLKRALPEKSEKEREKIRQQFQKRFTDLLLESIKGFTLSVDELNRRYKVINPDFLDEYYKKGQNVIALAGHNANWEWAAVTGTQVLSHYLIIYKELKNKHIDKYLRNNRERFNAKLFPTYSAGEAFKYDKDKSVIILISDQAPGKVTKEVWVDFFGHETACVIGPELFSKRYNWPVVFFDFQRAKRGYYTLEYSKLSDEPGQLAKNELIGLFMSELEKRIKQKPEDYLWTHKRWKHKRDGKQVFFDDIYD